MEQHFPWLPVKESDSVRVRDRAERCKWQKRARSERHAEADKDNSHLLLVFAAFHNGNGFVRSRYNIV